MTGPMGSGMVVSFQLSAVSKSSCVRHKIKKRAERLARRRDPPGSIVGAATFWRKQR